MNLKTLSFKKKMIGLSRGFTLIELLVVIAIIGILASVVLASLRDARVRGANGKIVAEISQARAQAALYASGNGGLFTDVCISGVGDDLFEIVTSVIALGTGVTCADSDAAWAIEAQLLGTTDFFCSDSTGTSQVYPVTSDITDGVTPSDPADPTGDYICGP